MKLDTDSINVAERKRDSSHNNLASPHVVDVTQEYTVADVLPNFAPEIRNDFIASRQTPEPKFLSCFRVATSCCCGCCSLKHSTVFLCVIDLTLGLASAGIVFMVIEEKLEPSSFLAIVMVNIIAMILAIPSLIAVLKPILPGVKSNVITLYTFWKAFEVFVCPILDVYALWQSTEFRTNGEDDGISNGEIEHELYNEEVYQEEGLPFV